MRGISIFAYIFLKAILPMANCSKNIAFRKTLNPGGYIKRTSTGGIKFILTSVFEGVGNGIICVDFISLN
jgi:hypothetical protein